MIPARAPAPALHTNIPAHADFTCHATGIPALQKVLSERAALLSESSDFCRPLCDTAWQVSGSSRKVVIPPSLTLTLLMWRIG
jgi:hypothetical protein